MFGQQARPLTHPLSVSPICLLSSRPRLSFYPPAPTLPILSARPPPSVATVGRGVLTPPAGAAATRVAAMKVASLSRCVDDASGAMAAYRRSASTVAPVVALPLASTRGS